MKSLLIITGGIGSGKSYIVKIFSTLNIPVYDADKRTKELYDKNRKLLASLISVLGDELVKDGVLDKVYMAKRIFNDACLLKKVEDIVYPFVMEDLMKWRMKYEDKDVSFLILESAIYLEKDFPKEPDDKILTVSSPEEIRIMRVMKRNRLSRKKVLERIKNQRDDAYRESLADFVILSDFKHPLLPQVLDVYKFMKKL